jgi:hypothetical protein
VFLVDELVIPSVRGDQRLDLLALRRLPTGSRLCLVELKSERALTELLNQTEAYAQFLNRHGDKLAELASAILGERVQLTEACEKWIVWPAAGAIRPEPRSAQLAKANVRAVGYRESELGFHFEPAEP